MSPDPGASLSGAHPTALVVEPASPDLLAILSALTSVGLDTTVAESYKSARAALDAQRPALLVTAIKLHEYNGLQLVLRARTSWPDLPAIVTSTVPDSVLQAEAERLGATFVVLPASQHELIAAVYRTVFRKPDPSGYMPPVRAPFERRTRKRAACSEGGAGARDERRRTPEELLRALVR